MILVGLGTHMQREIMIRFDTDHEKLVRYIMSRFFEAGPDDYTVYRVSPPLVFHDILVKETFMIQFAEAQAVDPKVLEGLIAKDEEVLGTWIHKTDPVAPKLTVTRNTASMYRFVARGYNIEQFFVNERHVWQDMKTKGYSRAD